MHSAEDRKDGWNEEDDQKIIDLRSKSLSWKEIAEKVNRTTAGAHRTAEGCSARYRKILPKDERPRVYNTGERWSTKDVDGLKSMIQQRMKSMDIATVLGKSLRSVQNKIQYLAQPRQVVHVELPARVSVPPHILEDRDRRMAAERDLTAQFFGDPPFSQSALASRSISP